jgi:lysozyme
MPRFEIAPEAINLIKAFEGARLAGYRDPIGIPTIGFGHTEMAGGMINYVDGQRTSKVRIGARITMAEAERLKAADIARFAAELDPLFKRDLNPLQYGAAMSLAFNIGPGNFRKSTVLRMINAGEFTKAAGAFLAWNKAGGKVLPGLTRRRRAERLLFLGDIKGAERETGESLRGTTPPSAPSDTTPAAGTPLAAQTPVSATNAKPGTNTPAAPATPPASPQPAMTWWDRLLKALRGG